MMVWFSSLLLLLGTSAGSLMAVIFKRVPMSVNLNLSFAGGVMLVASFTSLIIPGIQKGGFVQTSLGILMGFALIGIIEHLFPHQHVIKGAEGVIKSQKLKKLYLIVAGVAIHNIPEGFGVGVSSAYSLETGTATAIAIAIQDIPEGLIVTLALMVANDRIMVPIVAGVLSGIVESLFCLLGFYTFDTFRNFLALGLGIGGGAMIYITVKEVFPEVYSEGSHTVSTLGFLAGFLLMLFLDTALV
ncbi:MAG: ZIP family metal transporter [Hydrogenobacter thermophilus]|uniref:ZIP family metal transporter n=1 Tax=Hydrogenobacter thermophilus TaxID=940 RepID=UPI001C787A44|nr:ZIP family metal transporter [Hydrogenobacter thermophilus]QWK19933.1 MAG: ZIP family metal transporter [Hydrogenobacter thermophilus]